jgi:hypothetical protein
MPAREGAVSARDRGGPAANVRKKGQSSVLDGWIEDFTAYARTERGLAENTVEAYSRDLRLWSE